MIFKPVHQSSPVIVDYLEDGTLFGGVLATVVRLASWEESIPDEPTPDELTIGEGILGASTDNLASEYCVLTLTI